MTERARRRIRLGLLLALVGGGLGATLLLVVGSSSQQAGVVRYVNRTEPTCQGQLPCYGTIQAAVDAAQPRDRIVIQAGTYVEQVSISGKNNTGTATEADRIVLEADPAAPLGSVILV